MPAGNYVYNGPCCEKLAEASSLSQSAHKYAQKTALEQYNDLLISAVANYYANPLGFVTAMYPWGEEGPLQAYEGPDTWQKEFLIELGEEVAKRKFDGVHPVEPIFMTRSSGRGIGKSALCGMLVGWIMSTRPNCRGTVTANTFPQLQSTTWAEIHTWSKRLLTADWFECSSTKLYHKKFPMAWFTEAKTAKEENSESFLGQHAVNSTQYYIFDESSNIPNKIFDTAEAGLTDGEPMFFSFGNPTRNSGKFFQINFGSDRGQWKHKTIDGRTCSLTNKLQIKAWLETKGGEDSDWFRVWVRGLSPNAGDLQFIGNELVHDAQKREPQAMPDDPLIAGVDISRGGNADTICCYRRGLDARSLSPMRLTGEQARDSMVVASKLAEILTNRSPGRVVDVMFVDAGFGGAIVNRLRQLGFKNVFEVNFGSKSPDIHQANMRAFMWNRMKEWLTSGAIDKAEDLEIDLTGPGFHQNGKDQLVMESKEDMASRGLDSPDYADAMALTFAQKVAPAKSRPAPRVAYAQGGTAWS